MKELSQEEIIKYLGEWLDLTNEVSTIKNPFAQMLLFQSKMGDIFQKIFKKGYDLGLTENKAIVLKQISKEN
jgi:hypothetical protein